jgi:hypothetical protein
MPRPRHPSRARKSPAAARYAAVRRQAGAIRANSCRKTRERTPASAGTLFALLGGDLAVPGGAVVQDVVHSVFFTVVSVVAILLTVGLTGVILLIATDRDTPHADTPPRP